MLLGFIVLLGFRVYSAFRVYNVFSLRQLFLFVNIITKMAYRTRTLRKRKASRRKASRRGGRGTRRYRRGGWIATGSGSGCDQPVLC